MDAVNNKLGYIQQNLNAPKNKRNNHGNFNYRSAEDILNALKPLLKDTDCTLTVSDNIVDCGGRVYIKSTSKLFFDGSVIGEATAFAREAQQQKGMQDAQLTGSTSSYARKYSLNGLFLIDDSEDVDSMENLDDLIPDNFNQSQPTQNNYNNQNDDNKPWLNDNTPEMDNAVNYIMANKNNCSIDDLLFEIRKLNKVSKATEQKLRSL